MTILLFIRHGLTDQTGIRLSGWTPGLHLSPTGTAQADELVARLATVPVAAAYSSPLERCRETAAPLAKARGLRVRRDKAIGEVDYGDWTGRPLRQLARTKLWRTVQRNPSAARFPDGESLMEVQSRVVHASLRIAAAHPTSAVALFSHGDPIRLALNHFAGAPLDHFQRLVVAPASVSIVALGDDAPRVLAVNATGGLDGLFPPDGGRMH